MLRELRSEFRIAQFIRQEHNQKHRKDWMRKRLSAMQNTDGMLFAYPSMAKYNRGDVGRLSEDKVIKEVCAYD